MNHVLRPGWEDVGQSLTDSDQLEVVGLGPVDKPGNEGVNGGCVRLVHEGDVAVAAGAGLLELLLALLRGLAVPVARIDVVGDDAVAHGAHDVQHVAARAQVGRAHIGRLLAEDVDEGLLDLLHLRLDLRGPEVGQVGVRPRRNTCLLA